MEFICARRYLSAERNEKRRLIYARRCRWLHARISALRIKIKLQRARAKGSETEKQREREKERKRHIHIYEMYICKREDVGLNRVNSRAVINFSGTIIPRETRPNEEQE